MIIAYYELIGQASQQMLDSARRNDWEGVTRAEFRVNALVARLRLAGNTPQRLGGEKRKRRFQILHRVLADDAEIRNLAQPALRQLDAALGTGSGAARAAPQNSR